MASLRIASLEDGELRPTLAGLLALGTYPQKYFPRLTVTFAAYPGADKAADASVRFLDNEKMAGPIPAIIADTVAAVRRNMRVGGAMDGILRRDVPDYPLVAVREAVCNALMHRDYSALARGTQVQVNLYDDRIEFLSPGGLYGTVTADTIGEAGYSSTRNEYLADILESTPFEVGFVAENRGTGYKLMCRELEANGSSAPIVRDGVSMFSLTFERGGEASSGDALDDVLSFIAANGPCSAADMATALGIPQEHARLQAQKACQRGLCREDWSREEPLPEVSSSLIGGPHLFVSSCAGLRENLRKDAVPIRPWERIMLFATPFIAAYALALSVLLGLCMGSFLNCWAWRIVHGESILHGRSHCPSCGHALAARDLVPVASWLASHGRCRYCGEPVSARYPATELACAALYVVVLLRYDLTPEALQMLVFASCLFVLSLTDLEDWLIPNGALVVAVVARLVYIATTADPLALLASSAIAAVVVLVGLLLLVVVADRLLGRESMGGGDVKLLAVAALYFGLLQTLFLIVAACVLGIAFALVRRPVAGAGDAAGAGDPAASGTADATTAADAAAADAGADVRSRPFPFGPAIACACVLTMLVGEPLATWYLALL